MNIGIFGGTFNPPHRGHLTAARAAVEALGLDRLYVVPAAQPPHKPLPAGSPSPEARYRLTQLLFAGEEKVSVLDVELTRQGPSYTVDTAEALRRRHGEDTLYLLMGTDMFLSLEQWVAAPRLLNLVTPAVFARDDGENGAIRTQAERLRDRFGVETALVDHRVLPVSSTQLREALPLRRGRELLGDTVYAEIVERGHYGARAEYAFLRERTYALLKAARVPHVQGCEAEAVRLARRWGADEDLAREAAILHDITKALDTKQQLLLCEKYGIITDTVERESRKLLHAKTGAAMARARFGVPDEVYEAILYHTTGRPDMTLMDKVLYVADYIEPTRDFEEVHALRELAYRDLDAAVKYGLELSIEDLIALGITPHPRTREAIEWYTKGE